MNLAQMHHMLRKRGLIRMVGVTDKFTNKYAYYFILIIYQERFHQRWKEARFLKDVYLVIRYHAYKNQRNHNDTMNFAPVKAQLFNADLTNLHAARYFILPTSS